MTLTELTDDEFARFLALIYRASGIRIAETKRVLVSNRVRRRLRATGIETFAAYYAFLTSPAGAGEMPAFLDAVTTNETYFFRDQPHYDWLGDELIPGLLSEAAAHRRPRSLRIWSAACSTGEEPYSIALELADHRATLLGWRLSVLGTDLSGAALIAARGAVYEERALQRVDAETRKKRFDEDADGKRWTLKPDVRSLVAFRSHNLLKPLAVEPFDCVFLKNVLIYFDTNSKRTVVDNVLGSMAKGGFLVVGPTEGIHGMLGSLARIKPWLYQRTA
ncbi:MAG: protein-glutamate O-methyltransferase CheR [Paludisphaera borealis]|uniref:CheR family methyltransferase n=1 Tax=Paludisphaera borealis TaxID=1387353 RepID=UPI00283B8E3F|nr:protein-glutamate O-methyltransferase CheR [Paludisphaera borealis]MDR3618574.1 protein-glutamate O-methyltransferase CheR [Paludisphaera borealis]